MESSYKRRRVAGPKAAADASQPRAGGREGGLRLFSLRVIEKVKAAYPSRTTYQAVADSLCNELASAPQSAPRPGAKRKNAGGDDPQDPKGGKNIRRRVYDAINVCISAGLLERHKKEICWRGPKNGEIDRLRAQREALQKSIEQKRATLKDVEETRDTLQQLLDHRAAVAGGAANPGAAAATANGGHKYPLPFMLLQAQPGAKVQWLISEDRQLVQFDFIGTPFNIHDSTQVVRQLLDHKAANPQQQVMHVQQQQQAEVPVVAHVQQQALQQEQLQEQIPAQMQVQQGPQQVCATAEQAVGTTCPMPAPQPQPQVVVKAEQLQLPDLGAVCGAGQELQQQQQQLVHTKQEQQQQDQFSTPPHRNILPPGCLAPPPTLQPCQPASDHSQPMHTLLPSLQHQLQQHQHQPADDETSSFLNLFPLQQQQQPSCAASLSFGTPPDNHQRPCTHTGLAAANQPPNQLPYHPLPYTTDPQYSGLQYSSRQCSGQLSAGQQHSDPAPPSGFLPDDFFAASPAPHTAHGEPSVSSFACISGMPLDDDDWAHLQPLLPLLADPVPPGLGSGTGMGVIASPWRPASYGTPRALGGASLLDYQLPPPEQCRTGCPAQPVAPSLEVPLQL